MFLIDAYFAEYQLHDDDVVCLCARIHGPAGNDSAAVIKHDHGACCQCSVGFEPVKHAQERPLASYVFTRLRAVTITEWLYCVVDHRLNVTKCACCDNNAR